MPFNFGSVIGGIGDLFEGIGDTVGDALSGIGSLELDDIDWDFFAENALSSAEWVATMAAAVASGGTIGVALAGMDLLGVSDEVINQIMDPAQREALRQAREQQRQAYLARGGTGQSSSTSGSGLLMAVGAGLLVVALTRK